MYAKVQNYYFIDYKKYWMAALSSLKIPDYKSISEINNQLTVLTSGTSPVIGVFTCTKRKYYDLYTCRKIANQSKKNT